MAEEIGANETPKEAVPETAEEVKAALLAMTRIQEKDILDEKRLEAFLENQGYGLEEIDKLTPLFSKGAVFLPTFTLERNQEASTYLFPINYFREEVKGHELFLSPGRRFCIDGKDLYSLILEKIEGRESTGGFGIVKMGFDVRLENKVAIKFLKLSAGKSLERILDYYREARMTANVGEFDEIRSNIARVYDLGVVELKEGGIIPFIVEEVIVGDQANEAHLDRKSTVSVVKTIAGVLDFLHSKGIIHGDIKPSNIMIEEDGTPVLIDLSHCAGSYREGVLEKREDQPLELAFTPEYAAPETSLGGVVSPKADLHSLALTAYQLLVGGKVQVDFFGEENHINPSQKLRKFGSIPADVYQVISKAVSWNPEDRYATCSEFAKELEKACLESGFT